LENDTVAPGDVEMLRRILEKYQPVQNRGKNQIITSSNLVNLSSDCISLALKDEMDANNADVSVRDQQDKMVQTLEEDGIVPNDLSSREQKIEATSASPHISQQDLIIA
jgi:hypothetical protein